MRRLVVVDDDLAIRETFEMFFESRTDWECHTYHSFDEAMQSADVYADAYALDRDVPTGSFELSDMLGMLEEVNSEHILAWISGRTPSREEAKRFDIISQKPFKVTELYATIEAMLDPNYQMPKPALVGNLREHVNTS